MDILSGQHQGPVQRAVMAIRRHLGWKLFATYLILLAVMMVVLVTAASAAMPVAFERHLAEMAAAMGDAGALVEDLYINYQQALAEAVVPAVVISTVFAALLGYYFSRRIVAPVEEMTRASQRISEGHLHERVTSYAAPEGSGALDELGRLAVSFNRMADNLEHTETVRRELLGNVAHELRTPLTSIRGYMEGIIDGVLPADEETFRKVQREAERLQRLVHDLQELSRIEEGAVALAPRPVAVRRLVEGAAERLEPQFAGRGVSLEIDVPDRVGHVTVDEDRMVQVLLNLIGNALRFTPDGGRVTVRARRVDGRLRLEVTDTGIGILPEHLPHVFDRFYRAQDAPGHPGGGTGVGLTISRRLVELHGGTITASSEGQGRGSTFTVWLPAR